jgi:DNA-binding MarR family transcriptional regulator
MPSRRGSRNEPLADELHSAAIHLLRALRQADSASGLSAPRLSILSILVFAGPRTLGQLAEAEQVKPPTITRLVDALAREGLVRRARDRNDKRITHVRATTRGRKVIWAARTRRVGVLARQLDRLSPAELKVLKRAAAMIERLELFSRDPD